MKTQQEIEEMKRKLNRDIEELTERMVRTNNTLTIQDLGDRKRQKMAQYNILLEVLE